jgi:hypothetical protein
LSFQSVYLKSDLFAEQKANRKDADTFESRVTAKMDWEKVDDCHERRLETNGLKGEGGSMMSSRRKDDDDG